MILDTPRQSRGMENILPLINVIFLLLVFFILSGIFVTPELFEVHLPESASKAETEDEAIQILLSSDGMLAQGETFITLQQLRELLAQEKLRNSEVLLHVKADRKVVMRDVFEMMEVIKEAGYENFQLLTLQK